MTCCRSFPPLQLFFLRCAALTDISTLLPLLLSLLFAPHATISIAIPQLAPLLLLAPLCCLTDDPLTLCRHPRLYRRYFATNNEMT